MSRMRPNTTQEQTGGLYRGSALKRLALLENSCQRWSEDFVPPAAQRKAVRPTNPRGGTPEQQRSRVTPIPSALSCGDSN